MSRLLVFSPGSLSSTSTSAPNEKRGYKECLVSPPPLTRLQTQGTHVLAFQKTQDTKHKRNSRSLWQKVRQRSIKPVRVLRREIIKHGPDLARRHLGLEMRVRRLLPHVPLGPAADLPRPRLRAPRRCLAHVRRHVWGELGGTKVCTGVEEERERELVGGGRWTVVL